MASIACGKTYGVADGCKLCSVKIVDNDGDSRPRDLIYGIQFVVDTCGENDHCVINMSWSHFKNDLSQQVLTNLIRVVSKAFSKGIVMVACAGNEGKDACDLFPAGLAKVIAVGASSSPFQWREPVFAEGKPLIDSIPSFSGYGTCVNVFAPGLMIKGISNDNNETTIAGTSVSTACESSIFL